MEILEKDLKLVKGNGMTIAMSSVTMDMKELLARPDFKDDLEQFCKHQEAEVVVVMTLSSDINGKPVRDIAVYSQNRIFRDQISDSLDNSADVDLSLDLDYSPFDNITVYHQKNLKVSWKHVMPILHSFLCGDITPDVTSKEFVTQQSIAMATEGFSHFSGIVNPTVEGNVNKEYVQNSNINFDLYSPDLINVTIDNNSGCSDDAAEIVKNSNVDAPIIDQHTNVNLEDNSLVHSGQTDAAFNIITDFGEISNTAIHDNKMPDVQYDNMLEFNYFAQHKCVSEELYSHVPNSFEVFPNAQNHSSTELCTANFGNATNFDTMDKSELTDTFSEIDQSRNLVTSESTQQKDEKYDIMLENKRTEDDELTVMYVNDSRIQGQTELTQNVLISESLNLHPLGSDKQFDESFHDLGITKSANQIHKEDTTCVPEIVQEMKVDANIFIDSGLPAVSSDFFLDNTHILLDNSFNTAYKQNDQISVLSSIGSSSLIREVDAQSQSDNIAELSESNLYDAITTPEIQTLQEYSPFSTSGMNSPFMNSGMVSPLETISASSSRTVSEFGNICVPPNSLRDYTLNGSKRNNILSSLNSEEIVERVYKNNASLDRGIDCQGQVNEDGFNAPHSAQNRVRDNSNQLRKDTSLLSLKDDDIVDKVQEKRNCLVRDFISFEMDETAALRNAEIDTKGETSNPFLCYEHKTEDIFSDTEKSMNSANVFKDIDDLHSDKFHATDKTEVFTEFEIPDQELHKTSSKRIIICGNKEENTDFTNPFNDFDTMFASRSNVANNIQDNIDFRNPFNDLEYYSSFNITTTNDTGGNNNLKYSFDQTHVSPVSFDSTDLTNSFKDFNIMSSSRDEGMDNIQEGTQQFEDSKNVCFNKIDAVENLGLSSSAKCIQNITSDRVDIADKIEENEDFTNLFDGQRNKSTGSIDLSGNKEQETSFPNAFAGFECMPPVKNTNPFKNCDSVSTVTSNLYSVKESIDFTCLFKDLDNMSSVRLDSVDNVDENINFTNSFTDIEKSVTWVATEENKIKNNAVTNPFINVGNMSSLQTDFEENVMSSAVSLNPFENSSNMIEPHIEDAVANREERVVNLFSNNPFLQLDDRSLIQPIKTADQIINILPDSAYYCKDTEYFGCKNKQVFDQFKVKVEGSDKILDYSDSIPERDNQISLLHLIKFSGVDPNFEIKHQGQSVERACLNVLPDDFEETATNQNSYLDFETMFSKGVTENICGADDVKEQCENQSEHKAIAEHEITAELEDIDCIVTVSKKTDLVADLEICAELELIKSMSKAITKEIIENAVECFPDLTKPVIAETFTKEILNKDMNMTLEDPEKFDNFSQGSEDTHNMPLFDLTREVDKNKVCKGEFYIETDYLPSIDPLCGSLNIITSSSSNTQTIETDADKEVVEGESFWKYRHAEDSIKSSDTQSMLHLLDKDSIPDTMREMIILKNIAICKNTLDIVEGEVTTKDIDNVHAIREVDATRFMKENHTDIVGTSLSIDEKTNKYMVSGSNLDEDTVVDKIVTIDSHRGIKKSATELKTEKNVTPDESVDAQNSHMSNTNMLLYSEKLKNCDIKCVVDIADFNNSCEQIEIFTPIEALPHTSADRWLEKSGLHYNVESSTSTDSSSTTSFTSESEQDLITMKESPHDSEIDLSLGHMLSINPEPNFEIQERSSYSNKDNGFGDKTRDTNKHVSNVLDAQYDQNSFTPSLEVASDITVSTVTQDSISQVETTLDEQSNAYYEINPDLNNRLELPSDSWLENTEKQYNVDSSTSFGSNGTTSSTSEGEEDLIRVTENVINIDSSVLALEYDLRPMEPEPNLEEQEPSLKECKDDGFVEEGLNTDESVSKMTDTQLDLHLITPMITDSSASVNAVKIDGISQEDISMNEDVNVFGDVNPDIDHKLEPLADSWIENTYIKYNVQSSSSSDTSSTTSSSSESEQDLITVTENTGDNDTASSIKYHVSRREPKPMLEEYDFSNQESIADGFVDSRHNTNECVSDIMDAQYDLHALTPLSVDPDVTAYTETVDSIFQNEKTMDEHANTYYEVNPDVDNILELPSGSWLEERLDTDKSVPKVTETQLDLHLLTPITTDSGVTGDTVKIDSLSSPIDTSTYEDTTVFEDVNHDIDYKCEQLADSVFENAYIKCNVESSTSSGTSSTTSTSEREQDLITAMENPCNIGTALSLGHTMHAIDPDPYLEEKEFNSNGIKDNGGGDAIHDKNQRVSNVIAALHDLHSFTPSLEVDSDTTVNIVTLDCISKDETAMDELTNAYYKVNHDGDNMFEPSLDSKLENSCKQYDAVSSTSSNSNSITFSTSKSEQGLITATEDTGDIETVSSLGSIMSAMQKPNLEEDEFSSIDSKDDSFVEVRHSTNECVSNIIDAQYDLHTLSSSIAIHSGTTSCTLKTDNISQVETAMDEHTNVTYEEYPEIDNILELSLDSCLENSCLQYNVDSSISTDNSSTTSCTSKSEQDLITVTENTRDIEYHMSGIEPEPDLKEYEFSNQENKEDVFVDGRHDTNVSNVIPAVCDWDSFTPSIVIDSDTAMDGHDSAFDEANHENVDDFSITVVNLATYKEDVNGNVSDCNKVNAECMVHIESIAAIELLPHDEIPQKENSDTRYYQVAMDDINLINSNIETLGVKSYKSMQDDINFLVEEKDLAKNITGLNEVSINSADSYDETSPALVVHDLSTEICENKNYSLNINYIEMNEIVNNLNVGIETFRITPEVILENVDLDEPHGSDPVSCCKFSDANDVDEINANIQYTVLQNIQIGNVVSPFESPNEEVFDLGFEINPIAYEIGEDMLDSENEIDSNSSVIMAFAKDDAISEKFCKMVDNMVIGAMNDAFGSLKDSVSPLHDDNNELEIIVDSLVNSAIAEAVKISQNLNSIANVKQNKRNVLDTAKEIHSDYSSDSDMSSTTTEGSYRIQQSVEDSPLIVSPVQYFIADRLNRISSLDHDQISYNTTKLSFCEYDNFSDKHHPVDLTGVIMKDLSTDNIKPVSTDVQEDFVIHESAISEGYEDVVIYSKDFDRGEIILDVNGISFGKSDISRTDVSGFTTMSERCFAESSSDESRCFETSDVFSNSMTSFEDKTNSEVEIIGIQCIECDAEVPLKADVKETKMAALNLCGSSKDEISNEQSLITGRISDIFSAENYKMCDYQPTDLKLESTVHDLAFDAYINDTVMTNAKVVTSPSDNINKDDNEQQIETLDTVGATVIHLNDAYCTRRKLFHTTTGLMSVSLDSVKDALSSGCDQVSVPQGHNIIHEESKLLDEDQDIPPKETVVNVEPVFVKPNNSYEKMKEMDDTQEWHEDPIPGMGVTQDDGSSAYSDSSTDSDSEYVKPARPNSLFNETNPNKRIAPHSSTPDAADDLVEGTNDIPTPDDMEGELEWEDETPITPLSENKKFVDYHDDERERYENTQFRKVTIAGSDYKVDMHVIEPYKKVVSHGGYYGDGLNAIILFCGCYLPDRERNDYQYVMDNLFLYVISTLELLVVEDYMIVYFHGATPRRQMPSFSWLKRCYQMIDRRLKKNLKALLLVHPTLWLKTVVLMTKPFISSKFTSKLRFVKTLKELETIVPMEYIYVPDIIQQYDAKMTEHQPSTSSPDTSSLHS